LSKLILWFKRKEIITKKLELGHGSAYFIAHNSLGCPKIYARWIQDQLTDRWAPTNICGNINAVFVSFS
jgi:hypothetical protein